MKWDANALWLKARKYADRAHDAAEGDSDFPFWCSLSLEFLARACVSHVHPALLAKPDDDGIGLFFALGLPTKKQPQSVEMRTVYARIANITPEFSEHHEFCSQMAYWRNEELHTGELPFEQVKESQWLPRFYSAALCLCTMLGKTLEDYVGKERIGPAVQLIEAARKERISAVKKAVAAHAAVFKAKTEAERSALAEGCKDIHFAEYRGVPPGRTVVKQVCPACGCQARKFGQRVSETTPVLVDGQLEVTQTFLADQLSCSACALQLGSPGDLHIAECEPRFSETSTLDPNDIFNFEQDDPYMNM